MTDTGSTAVIGGISREFYQNIRAHYSDDAAWTTEKREDFPFFRAGEDALWRFEPKVAEKVYREMLAAAKVEIITGERLDLRGSAGVEKEHLTIRAIIMESGRKFTGQRFIDATYEGDLMAKAGVSYHVGRESNATYGETLNGIQTRNARHHQFASNVDPYIVPGDPASGLLPGIHGNGPGEEGAGDKRVQAYCFRMCMTDAPENRVPFPKPDDYDPLRYELFARYLKASMREETIAYITALFTDNRPAGELVHSGAARYRQRRIHRMVPSFLSVAFPDRASPLYQPPSFVGQIDRCWLTT